MSEALDRRLVVPIADQIARLERLVKSQGARLRLQDRELRRLCRLVDRERPRDEWHETELLAALASEHVGQTHFTSAEVIDFARRVKAAVLLRQTLYSLQAETPRKLGKWLAKMEGRQLGDRMVSRVGEEASGIIWTIEFVGLAASKPTAPVVGY